MVATFSEEGIRFRYPANWKMEREDNELGWTIYLQSPGTAFLMLSLRADMPSSEQMAATALEAMRDEYPDLEADACEDMIAGEPACGHDMRFFSLDLTNTAWTRCFYCTAGTALLLCQINDLESNDNEQVLRAICASFELDDE